MQYFKPSGSYFAGDCMPFYHDGVFHLYYLLDENHHAALGGLGGHQWAHASTNDLVHWTHHPLALAITQDFEGSICTGSVFYHAGTYYAFYATRMRDYTQHLGLATSQDAIHFEKTLPNPLASPQPGYHRDHFRDPVVFQDPATGEFHLLITAQRENYPVTRRGGCLAHLVSQDLAHWENKQPFLYPGFADVPECADFFEWNGWYYLVFSNGGVARYRMSREPLGPWLRPALDTFEGPAARVMKTAAFGKNRRIGAAWLGTRSGDRDSGSLQFGGNILLREIIQHPDGTLSAAILPETLAQSTDTSVYSAESTALTPPSGLEATRIDPLPQNYHLSARVIPVSGMGNFGLHLRAGETFDSGYDLRFSTVEKTIQLNQQPLTQVDLIQRPFQLDMIVHGPIIDVSIGGERCLVDRCPEANGASLYLYAWDCAVTFEIDQNYPQIGLQHGLRCSSCIKKQLR